MKKIRYTLLSDGSSDRMLMPLLDWLLYQHCPEAVIESGWADLGRLPKPPKTLPDKIKVALDIYPCDLLFIHRDAEKEPYAKRYAEIVTALHEVETPLTICVIPVRMQEAWFLFDKAAIRRASGKPNSSTPLTLPNLNSIESLPDPKQLLFDAIRDSSGLSGARLKKLNPNKCAFLVAQYIDDFSPLRAVSSFQALEHQLADTLLANGRKSAR